MLFEQVFESNGPTETCGAITYSIYGGLGGGNVAPPVPHCENKLIDIADVGLVVSRDNKDE